MAYSLKEQLSKEERFVGGHRLCAGCGAGKRPPPRMPARQSTSSASKRWKRSAKVPCARMRQLRRMSKRHPGPEHWNAPIVFVEKTMGFVLRRKL